MRLLAAAQPLRMLNDRFRCWPRTALDPEPTFRLLKSRPSNVQNHRPRAAFRARSMCIAGLAAAKSMYAGDLMFI